MTAVFIGILVLFKCGVYALEYNFTGDIRNVVVGNNKVYVVTDSKLHQMRHDLVEERSKDLSNLTHSINVTILLPFETNGTLITCGSYHSGYLKTADYGNGDCEVLDINDITKTIYAEFLQVPSVNKSSVAFLVDFYKSNEVKHDTYLLVASHDNDKSFRGGVSLWNTLLSQSGGIFSEVPSSSSSASVKTKGDVDWLDGFQTSSHSYLFLNNKSAESSVMLLRMDNSGKKTEMTKSLKGATLECCDDKTRGKLISSAVISYGTPLLWAGIFTAQEELQNTALAIFDISNPGEHVPSHFCCFPTCSNKNGDTTLRPQAVVFRQTSMTSVAAQQIGSWIVLYIGTGNGQLIKLVLDKNLRPGCAVVLYRSDDDRMLFPRMHFDPVDHKYIYIALRNQIQRVAVTQCELFITLRDCRSSPDPLCGWCMTTNKCSTQDECSNSTWISIPDNSFQKELISFQVTDNSTNSLNQLIMVLHLSVEDTGRPSFSCTFRSGRKDLCDSRPTAVFPKCSCSFSSQDLPTEGLQVTATVTIGDETLTESLNLKNCLNISETSPYDQCTACVSAGCHWSSRSQTCSWYNVVTQQVHIQDVCTELSTGKNSTPEIVSLRPTQVSFHGRNNASMKGRNLEQVVKIRFQGILDCSPKESPVLQRSSDTLRFHIPSGNKGTVRVCVVMPDGSCHSNTFITYGSQPTCTALHPSNTWTSGGRQIHVLGTNLENAEEVSVHSPSTKISLNTSSMSFWFYSYDERQFQAPGPFNVFLIVANTTVHCAQPLHYHPDPEFTSFDTSVVGDDMLINIQKKEDKLNLSMEELNVFGMQEDESFSCLVVELKSTTVQCKIDGGKVLSVTSLRIESGYIKKILKQSPTFAIYLCIPFFLILFGAIAGVWIHRKSNKQLNDRMNERLELIESEIRNEIRQGFVDLQTDKSDLIENVGAIPFLDYKHFAMKIFFPEGGPIASSMVKDISQVVSVKPDERCKALSILIRDQMFLTCFVHALEEQKNFSIKDKCIVASLLTVALHSDLPYLTQVMEDLLQSLMDQPSNAQPKLLLRRTESIVEKLLTNWMSICLYGFLRETVGQPLFLLVSALTQQISKGPVDAVTEKALYTLNEDWLLWQAQDFDFSPLKLKVLFAVGTEGEVSDPLEVNALTCDTIAQVKDKILQSFQRKFGFSYTQQLRDIGIEYEKEGSYVALEEVDGSSEVQGDVTMLNTLRLYKIPDGASLKVITKKVHAPLSPQTSLKDDQNFSLKYFHLIDPDIDRDQSSHPERKKLKLKEIYLTKLLSTKVAVHSFVENLFQSIWGMPHNKAPIAVKYFFDFLDTQAEKKKITDPDVVHIWKTNSLPLRFWVNILKNPNFVFSDLEKTPHLDGCLSVIAQAFMDSFSLTDQQLGKHAPTNKLLYAKDIPKYKQEVKTYYKLVGDQTSVNSQEFKAFLQEESKKHEYEFSESAALRELYKYMQRYFTEIELKLKQKGASPELKEEMYHVRDLYEDLKKSAWV